MPEELLILFEAPRFAQFPELVTDIPPFTEIVPIFPLAENFTIIFSAFAPSGISSERFTLYIPFTESDFPGFITVLPFASADEVFVVVVVFAVVFNVVLEVFLAVEDDVVLEVVFAVVFTVVEVVVIVVAAVVAVVKTGVEPPETPGMLESTD